MPGVYECLEAERIKYAIRLPANQVLQNRIAYLLKRPVGRPPNEVRRYYANFTYQAGSWTKPRRVVAKVEWHPGELIPRVGFIVTNMSRPAERVVAFYNKRGTCEQWIKEGKGAIHWTRLSCRTFAANAVRLQLHALAYNLGKLPAHAGDARADQGLVADEPEGEADQDRRQGRQPRPLRRLPDGRGRHPTANVPGRFCGSLPRCNRSHRLHRHEAPMLMRFIKSDRRSLPINASENGAARPLGRRSGRQRWRRSSAPPVRFSKK